MMPIGGIIAMALYGKTAFAYSKACVKWPLKKRQNKDLNVTGMRKFRIDQDFLIEHWHMIYKMPVVFAEIYFWMKLNSILDLNQA